MFIKNARLIEGIKIPKYLKSNISILTTCNLSEDIIELFNISLQETFEQIYFVDSFKDPDFEIHKVNVIFTDNGHIEFAEEEDNNALGEYARVIVYKMNKINLLNDDIRKMFVFVEELAHHFWRIEDEVKVKFKVVEILKRYNNSINILKEEKGWKVTWEKK